MYSLVSINERPESIAETSLSESGKSLGRHQICDDSSTEPHHLVKPSRSQRCIISAELRSDSLYQPHSGSHLTGIMWLEDKLLGVLVPALQASKGTSRRDEMTLIGQGLVCPDTT